MVTSGNDQEAPKMGISEDHVFSEAPQGAVGGTQLMHGQRGSTRSAVTRTAQQHPRSKKRREPTDLPFSSPAKGRQRRKMELLWNVAADICLRKWQPGYFKIFKPLKKHMENMLVIGDRESSWVIPFLWIKITKWCCKSTGAPFRGGPIETLKYFHLWPEDGPFADLPLKNSDFPWLSSSQTHQRVNHAHSQEVALNPRKKTAHTARFSALELRRPKTSWSRCLQAVWLCKWGNMLHPSLAKTGTGMASYDQDRNYGDLVSREPFISQLFGRKIINASNMMFWMIRELFYVFWNMYSGTEGILNSGNHPTTMLKMVCHCKPMRLTSWVLNDESPD